MKELPEEILDDCVPPLKFPIFQLIMGIINLSLFSFNAWLYFTGSHHWQPIAVLNGVMVFYCFDKWIEKYKEYKKSKPVN